MARYRRFDVDHGAAERHADAIESVRRAPSRV